MRSVDLSTEEVAVNLDRGSRAAEFLHAPLTVVVPSVGKLSFDQSVASALATALSKEEKVELITSTASVRGFG